MIFLFLLALSLTIVNSMHRPSYILPCSRRLNFTTCALDHSKKVLPYILKGDRRLGLARMNPLELTLVELNGADDFHLAIKNIKVYGLETVEVAKFDVNFERQKAHVISRASPVVILGDYKMNGHLMIFPLNGHGLVNITLVEGLYDYELEWTMENRNGAEYAKIIKSSYDYQLGNMIYNFTNLMNGDERLSLELNKVLNDNWRVVNEELKNSIQKTLLTIHDNLFSMIFSHIPFRELFLD